jgi:HSP20 family molecular chaperone IbpA
MTPDQTAHREVVEATETAEATITPQEVPVNMYETSGALVIVAPLPAVMPDDVTIELHGNMLRIHASVRSAGVRDYLVHEWDYGGYVRELSLPEGFGAGMEASLANGQLAIRVLRGDPLNSLTIQPERG